MLQHTTCHEACSQCVYNWHASLLKLGSMQTGWWGGNTLLIDFPFPAFPDSMGHWAEVLLPVYSTLVTGEWKRHVQGTSSHIDRLLLSNVRRDHLQV